MQKPILVGAVLYDPKVSVIWDIIADFFAQNNCPIDVVYYTNYELQVEALIAGHFDIAWNSPLAWLDAQRRSNNTCRAIAMRDTDRDRVSHIITRTNSGLNRIADLKGKTIAVGAKDSPQATLIPLGLLQRHGIAPGKDIRVIRHDVLVGKHGDHIGGERDAFETLRRGDAQASAVLDLNYDRWTQDGTVNPAEYRILATTHTFDHCVFTVRGDFAPEKQKPWLDVLFSMSYDNPKHREMMDMEGLKAWQIGRTSGFAALSEAVERQGFFNA